MKVHPKIKNRGSALAMVLMFMVLISMLGFGLMAQAYYNGLNLIRDIQKTQAFWAAEAGIEKATYIIANKPNLWSRLIPYIESDFKLSTSPCSYTTFITSQGDDYLVTSKAKTHSSYLASLSCVMVASEYLDGTVGHWEIDPDAGNVIKDSSGNNNHATMEHIPQSAWLEDGRGEDNYVLSIDGLNQYISTEAGSVSSLYNNDVTFASWFKATPIWFSWSTLLSEHDDNSKKIIWEIVAMVENHIFSESITYVFRVRTEAYGYFLSVFNSEEVHLKITDSRMSNGPKFGIFDWHHIAVTYQNEDNNKAKIGIVVDGNSTYSNNETIARWVGRSNGNFGGWDTGSDSNVVVMAGRYAYFGLPLSPFFGDIDDVRIYDEVLSLQDIEKLANDQNINTSSTSALSYARGQWRYGKVQLN